jgi:hypothetical protein
LNALTTIELNITEAQFIQMTKTLILKRVQDVFKSAKSHRPDNCIRINRNIIVPAPIADLLHSLGHFTSTSGKHHHLIPPPRPVAVLAWANVDNEILELWIRDMGRLSPLYTMKDYPSFQQCDSRPLMLTFIQDTGVERQVRAFTPEPQKTDAYIRLINDDLFEEHAYMTFENSALNATQRLNRRQIIHSYVG